jgi:hypothetical protein
MIHQNKSQEARTRWYGSLVLVVSKLVNFSHRKVHYGVILKDYAGKYDPSHPDLNILLNRLYLAYYKTPQEFWTELGQTLQGARAMRPQSNLHRIAAMLLACAAHLYGQWHRLSRHRYLALLLNPPKALLEPPALAQEQAQQLQLELDGLGPLENSLLENREQFASLEQFDPGEFSLEWAGPPE